LQLLSAWEVQSVILTIALIAKPMFLWMATTAFPALKVLVGSLAMLQEMT
jgi:hypothetical protein